MIDIDVTPLTRLPEVVISSYIPKDYDHAYRVIREIGTDHLGRDLRAWNKAFEGLSSFMWVATVKDIPLAFAGLSIPNDGFIFLHTDLVSPQFQRRGLGTLLTLIRFGALVEDDLDGIGVLATEKSAPFYGRFGFQLEADPQLDPFAGCHIHRMSMPFSPQFAMSADSLVDGLDRVTFDHDHDYNPFSENAEP